MFSFVLALFAFLAQLKAARQASPGSDGCYDGYTTTDGCNALNFLSTALGNTGLGWYALYSNTTGNYNTGVGGGALALNNADSNTAVGAAALLLNTGGSLTNMSEEIQQVCSAFAPAKLKRVPPTTRRLARLGAVIFFR